MRIIIDSLRIGTRFGLQYARRCGILGGFVFFPGDELVFIHAPKHIIRPVVRHRGKIRFPVAAGIEIPPGVVIVRIVGHARQHRALAQGQLLQFLAEEAFRRDLDTVVAFTKVDGIQVGFQDFILGIPGLQLQGQVRFLDLPLVALLRRKQRVLDQLLGNRGTALGAGCGQVGNKRAGNPLDVHAVMGIEPRVLHRDKRVAQALRHSIQRDHFTVFSAAVGGQEAFVPVIER